MKKFIVLMIAVIFVAGFQLNAQAYVVMALVGPGDVEVGNQFTVDMYLSNPGPAELSAMNAWLSFDPNYLEVIDSDAGNWITEGVNILDGPYHSVFNWGIHGQNVADNSAGTISYGEGSFPMEPVTGEGQFGQIRFLAKAPVNGTTIAILRTGTGGLDDTYVMDTSGYDLFIMGVGTAVDINPIPEPLTLSLFGLGLPSILLVRRANRKSKN